QAVLGIAGPPEQKPFIITHVQPQTGAAEAGLKAGDIVRSIDGKPIADFSELTFHIAGKGVGDVLAIEFEREGKTMVRKATLGDRAKLNQ
ncbi:MAG: PDZ domain-containing protein, partial [bacterium]|nr:PDZ domain-containing protein [bacterium]